MRNDEIVKGTCNACTGEGKVRHWDTHYPFDVENVKEFAQFFGLTYFPEKDQIIHSLRTAIVTPEGKIAKIYSGNEWKPEQVVDEMSKTIRR